MICDIVTPDQMFFSDEVSFVVAPAANGEIGLMEAASPIMSTLRLGEVKVKTNENDELRRFAVAGGYLESDGHKVVILANRAIDTVDIDTEFAQRRISSYQKRLDEAAPNDSRTVFYKEEIVWQQYLANLAGK